VNVAVFDGLVVFNLARLRKCDDELCRIFFGYVAQTWEAWL
jgi:hypothetical protein